MRARLFLAAAWSLTLCCAVSACSGDDDLASNSDASPGDDASPSTDATIDGPHDSALDAHDSNSDATVRDGGEDASLDGAGGDADLEASDSSFDAAIYNPPLLVAPASTSREESHQPTFKWGIAAASVTQMLEICHDRACTDPIGAPVDMSGLPGEYVPSAPLPTGLIYWRMRATYGEGATAATLYSATWEFTIGPLEIVDTTLGRTLDVNGDGFADVAIGAPGENKVYVYVGAASGLSPTPATTLTGPDGGSFGTSVSSAGDINGDGFADLIVGAPQVLGGAGSIYIYFGSASGLASTPGTTWPSPFGSDAFFGTSVTSGGDVNNDGYGDVAVGAYGVSMATGRVYFANGSASGVLTNNGEIDDPNATHFDFFGFAVASGTFFGTQPDLLVGADGTSGLTTAYLVSGNSGSFLSAPAALSVPDGGAGDFGKSVASVGDVNGDGYEDFAVGAPSAAGLMGEAFVYLGPAASIPVPATTLAGAGANWQLGGSISSADTNGDGYSDVVVGTTDGTSAAVVYLGSSSGLSTTGTTLLAAGGVTYPNQVACAGDVNGDGYADLLVGAAGVGGDAGASTGTVYLFMGGPSAPKATPDLVLTGNAGSQFGRSLFGATN